jgi:hypothetical protein
VGYTQKRSHFLNNTFLTHFPPTPNGPPPLLWLHHKSIPFWFLLCQMCSTSIQCQMAGAGAHGTRAWPKACAQPCSTLCVWSTLLTSHPFSFPTTMFTWFWLPHRLNMLQRRIIIFLTYKFHELCLSTTIRMKHVLTICPFT